MYVFVVMAFRMTPQGINVDVEGVFEHVAQAMPHAKALRDTGLADFTKIVRKDLITGPSVKVKIGPAEPAFTPPNLPLCTICNKRMSGAISQHMLEAHPERVDTERAIAKRLIERSAGR